MKRKLLAIALFAFVLICLNTVVSYGAISASSKTVNSGENVTISVSSAESLGAYTIQVTDNGGLTFVSSTAPAGFAANGKKISGASTTGVTSLGSFTFKAPSVSKDTTYYVKITSTGTEGPNTEIVGPSTATATITVKAPVQQPSPKPTPAPTFSSVNETVYATTDVNVRSSYNTSSSKIGLLPKGQSATRTGVGSNGWSKVTYNGKTGYIMSSYLTTTKPAEVTNTPKPTPSTKPSEKPEEKSNDSTLKTLSITGVEFTPEFNSSTTSYVANIGAEITEVEVLAEVNNEKATYEITGNTELQDGENRVIVTVTAEDGTVTNYEIKLIKGDEAIPLNALAIVGIKENDDQVNISLGEPNIVEGVVEYTINLSEFMKSIDIHALYSSDLNQYEGIGKFDLKVGENKFAVVLKQQSEETEPKVTEYILTINNPEKVVETVKEDNKINYKLIAIISAIVLVTILAITLLIVHYKKQNKVEYAEADYSFLKNDESIQNKEKEREEKIKENDIGKDNEGRRKGGKHF